MDYIASGPIDDFEIYQLESIPAGAVSQAGRTALWFDLEAGGESASLRGANRLLELADGTVIAVVNETATFHSNGLPAFALTVGTWGVKHRFGRGQRVTEKILPNLPRGEFQLPNRESRWDAAGFQAPHRIEGTGQARLARGASDWLADLTVDTRSRTDLAKGRA